MDAIILIPIISGIGLIFWSSEVKDTQPILALVLQLMFLPLVLLSLQLGMSEAALTYASDSELVHTLADIVYYIGILIFIVGGYYFFKILGALKDFFIQRKKDKEAERHGD